MGKRKTPESEYIQKRCVIPTRKEKEKAFKEGNYSEFVLQSFQEEYCKGLREELKK